MFAAVLGQLENDNASATGSSAAKFSSPHLLKVAAGVRQMQERSDLAEKLLKDGEQILELDPDDILPSTIPDRFDSAYDAAAIAEIVDSMRERGQIVPGLVRPVAKGEGSSRLSMVAGDWPPPRYSASSSAPPSAASPTSRPSFFKAKKTPPARTFPISRNVHSPLPRNRLASNEKLSPPRCRPASPTSQK